MAVRLEQLKASSVAVGTANAANAETTAAVDAVTLLSKVGSVLSAACVNKRNKVRSALCFRKFLRQSIFTIMKVLTDFCIEKFAIW